MARTGRRPGNQDTREAILTAAREAFSERGYDKASIRAIATSAGVDPALVHHYFGTKDELFLAAVEAPLDPTELVSKIVAGGTDGLPERLLRTFLSVWDHPVTGPGALALVRSALQHDWSARMLREFLTAKILRRVVGQLGIIDAAESQLRGSLVASQMIGLVMIRYVLRLEPLASASPDTIVAAVGPNIHRYLFEPLPAPAAPVR
jgi:AcrR family transcriptional regulator